MRIQVSEWSKKPFPVVQSAREKLIISFGSALVVVGILLLIKPFGIDSHNGIIFFLVGFGIIDLVVTASNLFLLPVVLPTSKLANWTTGKNLLFIVWVLFAISVANYFYGEHLADKVPVSGLNNLNKAGLLKWMGMTFSIGIFPVVFALYFIERRLFEKNRLLAEKLSEGKEHSGAQEHSQQIELKASSDTSLKIDSASLLCVKSEGGNYASVYWTENSVLKKEVIRLTLVGFLAEIKNVSNIVRCHKSFVINLGRVTSYRGNARSVTVRLDCIDFDIPVSRNFPRERFIEKS